MKREAVDDARRATRETVAFRAPGRVKQTLQHWERVEQACIENDGLAAISVALRTIPALAQLPPSLLKTAEWLRSRFVN